VEDITALQKGKIGKDLKKFLTQHIVDKGKAKESLVVVDTNLGSFSPAPIQARNDRTL
jgi:nucleolar protein 58